MAGFKRPSFLKRQKEQKRVAKQAAKREARFERKRERLEDKDPVELEELLGEGDEQEPTVDDAEAASDDSARNP